MNKQKAYKSQPQHIETFRCTYTGCGETGLSSAGLYLHGKQLHKSWLGAGYPEKPTERRSGE